MDAVKARCQGGPVCLKLCSEAAKGWPARVEDTQIVHPEGVQLDRDIVQPRTASRIRLPGGPGHQKIQPQTEAGFKDHEARTSSPAMGQRIAAQKHGFRLLRTTIAGMVDVIEDLGPGCAILTQCKTGRDQRVRLPRTHVRAGTFIPPASAETGSHRECLRCLSAA